MPKLIGRVLNSKILRETIYSKDKYSGNETEKRRHLFTVLWILTLSFQVLLTPSLSQSSGLPGSEEFCKLDFLTIHQFHEHVELAEDVKVASFEHFWTA